jgi:hypothetical protein
MPEPRRWRLELDADFCRTGFGVASVHLDDSTRCAFTAQMLKPANFGGCLPENVLTLVIRRRSLSHVRGS